MKTCRTCRYFERAGSTESEAYRRGFGVCRRWPLLGATLDTIRDDELILEIKADEMIIGPDFGCTLHEARP